MLHVVYLATKRSTARKKAEKTVPETNAQEKNPSHSHLVHKRLQSMMEKEPQISRRRFLLILHYVVACENVKHLLIRH